MAGAAAEQEYVLNDGCPFCDVRTLADRCEQAFSEHFEHPDNGPFHFAVTPGRFFLMGEHAQACRDFALAMTAPYYLVAYGRRRTAGDFTTMMYDCASERMYEIKQPYTIRRLYEPEQVKTVRAILAVAPFTIDMDIVIATSMPDGVNVGQEAALELSVAVLHHRLTSEMHPPRSYYTMKDYVDLCLKAEKRHFGYRYNMVDLMVQTVTRPKKFILFDAQAGHGVKHMRLAAATLDFEGEKDVAFIVIDSGVRCADLMKKMDDKWAKMWYTGRLMLAHDWRSVPRHMVTSYMRGWMLDVGMHMYNEIERTDMAISAFLNNDYRLLGRLMTESHVSSRELLGVSCPEVDQIVQLSLQVPGVHGSRIAGYGFGGFVITVVERKRIRNLVEHVKAHYNGNATFRECIPVEHVVLYTVR